PRQGGEGRWPYHDNIRRNGQAWLSDLGYRRRDEYLCRKISGLCREVHQGRMRRHRLLAQESRQDRRNHRGGADAAARRCDADNEWHGHGSLRQAAYRPVPWHVGEERAVRGYAGLDRGFPCQAGTLAEALVPFRVRGFYPACLSGEGRGPLIFNGKSSSTVSHLS